MGFDPASLAIIGTIATVGQMGLGVAGSLISSASEQEAAKRAEELALKNKQIAEENAVRTLLVGQEEQFDLDMENGQLLAEQEVIQAASGLVMESPSFMQTRRNARELARVDALNMREAANIRAAAYLNEGDAYAADAAAARIARGNAATSGFLGAASSIIGGASRLVSAAPTKTGGYMTVPETRLLR